MTCLKLKLQRPTKSGLFPTALIFKMSEELKIPSSGGGLMRYGEGGESKIQVKPVHVVALIIAIIVIELILRVTNIFPILG